MAACDDSGIPIRGLPTIDRKKNPDILSVLSSVIAEEQPERLIFGLPLDVNDAETVMSKEVRTFAGNLSERTGLPVEFVDESLSSQRAEELLRHRKKKQRRDKGAVDRLAACLILDQYMKETGSI